MCYSSMIQEINKSIQNSCTVSSSFYLTATFNQYCELYNNAHQLIIHRCFELRLTNSRGSRKNQVKRPWALKKKVGT